MPDPGPVSLAGAGWRIRGFLGDEWHWARLGDPHPDWLPARVPGSVIDDLVRAGVVADVTLGLNSRAAEWVPQRSWAYQRSFLAEPEWRAAWGSDARVELRFEGIDHEAQVVLNGAPLGRHRGMFTPAAFEVGERLRWDADEPNLLGVIVAPAPDEQGQVGDTRRVRTHRARMGHGWDFCPRIVHTGIWDDVVLRPSGPVRLGEPWVRPILDAPMRTAEVRVSAALDAAAACAVQIRAVLRLAGAVVAEERIGLEAEAGCSSSELVLGLDRPSLWWPNGSGAQPLYELELSAGVNGMASDRRRVRFGVRRVELAGNDTPDATSRPYLVVVNGHRTYLNGWNWVPIDACYGVPRHDRLGRLLELARRAHVNLLRVWGGGLIERRAFYDRCDELGLMVWQEFAQSSSSIVNRPSRSRAFVEMMRAEARAVVPRRRNHPSLVIWCGGNELSDLDGRPLDDREPVLGALRAEVERADPDRAWLPTSPTGRVGNVSLEAIERDPLGLHDVHGPWEHQGLGRHEALHDAGTWLLHSELGVEGMANRATIEASVPEADRWPPTRANPQWAHRGAWWINEPLVQATFGGGIDDLEELIRASQYLQASGLAYAVEANRRRQWRSSGVIPWQLNEPFPNGWCTSAVDYHGRPKPAYHAVAATYAPLALSARFATQAWGGRRAFDAGVWASSALTGEVAGTWHARLVDAAGEPLAASEGAGRVPAGSARRLGSLRAPLPDGDGPLLLLLAWHDADGRLAAERRYLFSSGRDLSSFRRLPPTRLEVDDERGADAWMLRLRNEGGTIALLVRIEDARPLEAPGWPYLSDDLVTLLPREEGRIGVDWDGVPRSGRRLRLRGWNTAEVVVAG